MKIKEAAAYCGLTEKAIRLYESKGLICPRIEEKNGRLYREYDADAIRALLTVGTLRRAGFSMEQISVMQTQPERIPEVFAVYREEVRENAQRMTALSIAMDSLEEGELPSLDEFARRLAAAMEPVHAKRSLPGETCEPTMAEAPPHFRMYVWDEEISSDEKEDALRRFMEKQQKRDRFDAVAFAIPRKIAGGFRRMFGYINAKLRGEDQRIKKTVILTVVFTSILCVLTAVLVSSEMKAAAVKRSTASTVFHSLKEIDRCLEYAVLTGTYDARAAEKVGIYFSRMEGAIQTADQLYARGHARELRGVINAVGCAYAAVHNNTWVESILYDGVVSEQEYAFLEALRADVCALYEPMLAEDGLNMRRGGVSYDEIREEVGEFTDKWGDWRVSSLGGGAPYALLDRES